VDEAELVPGLLLMEGMAVDYLPVAIVVLTRSLAGRRRRRWRRWMTVAVVIPTRWRWLVIPWMSISAVGAISTA
jgi:hypothetical protein